MKLNLNKAQLISSEYVLTYVLVVVTLSAMGVYIKRAIQGRVRDANRHVLNRMSEKGFTNPGGMNIWAQYEPYYLKSEAVRGFQGDTKKNLVPVVPGETGIFRENTQEDRDTTSSGSQLPPKDAD